MTDDNKKELWSYGTFIFSLPQLHLEDVEKIIGSANIKEVIESALYVIKQALLHIKLVEKKIELVNTDKNYIDGRPPKLLIKEINAYTTRSHLIHKNMYNFVTLLSSLYSKAPESKFALPQFRSVEHFSIGDEIMMYVGEVTQNNRMVEYDWISGKMLIPVKDLMHCFSNKPWTLDGSYSGYYLRITDQNLIFKRSDFYGLRKMLEQNEDTSFINLLPAELAKKILSGSVEPLTDEELSANQAEYIGEMMNVSDNLQNLILEIANRYGVAI